MMRKFAVLKEGSVSLPPSLRERKATPASRRAGLAAAAAQVVADRRGRIAALGAAGAKRLDEQGAGHGGGGGGVSSTVKPVAPDLPPVVTVTERDAGLARRATSPTNLNAKG